MEQIERFIKELSEYPNKNKVFNPYTQPVQRNNLRIYLSEMKKINPKIILVGEAPGYKGCRKTGIPFTSEYIMINKKSNKLKKINIKIFGRDKGYKPTSKNKLEKEITATIVWDILRKKELPLLWNIFPFHPYEKTQEKNRKPTEEETKKGVKYLMNLREIFQIEKVVAVGKTAEKGLKDLTNSTIEAVPHPSFGGKNKFKEGINKILKNNPKINQKR